MDKEKLIKEIRDDYQIPPYYENAVIERAVDECSTRLLFLKPGTDFDTDYQGRALLKNAVYYSLFHRYEEFEQNYMNLILSWQLGAST